MSEPKRYIAKAIIHPRRDDNTYEVEAVEDLNGDWVAYEDYARLKAEVERLQKAIMDSVEMRQRLREIENGNQSK